MKNTTTTGVLSIASAGTDYIAGSVGANHQIAYFTGTGVLAGSNSLWFDGANVGIGTTTPGGKMEISGGNLKMTSGNIALNGNWLSGDGGNEGVFVDSSGYVGIGGDLAGGVTPSALNVYGNINLPSGGSITANSLAIGGGGGDITVQAGNSSLAPGQNGKNLYLYGGNSLMSGTGGSVFIDAWQRHRLRKYITGECGWKCRNRHHDPLR